MKRMFFLGACVAPMIGFSQGVAQMNEMNVLYRGYENVIEIGVPKGLKEYDVFAEGATIRKQGNSWIVKTQDQKFVTIGVLNKKGDTLGRQEYRCLNMPQPEIHFGGISNGGTVSDLSSILAIEYSQLYWPAPGLNWKFVSFDLQIPEIDETFSISGNTITSSIQEMIKSKPLPMTISIVATVEGPGGFLRKQAATYTIVE